MDAVIFFYVYTQKIFYVKKSFFFSKFKTILIDLINRQVNNLDDMEREQFFFYRRKAIFWKN